MASRWPTASIVTAGKMINGTMMIGRVERRGAGPAFYAIAAATGETIDPVFDSATLDDVAEVCALAEAAAADFAALPLDQRADFLESIADHILAVGDALVERAMIESGLPRGRLEGERGRTVGQLRLFAGVVRDGSFQNVRVDAALLDRQPVPRPDLRLRNIPLGPVVVFGASNFPLAFSVAGGDTASALAAGCPVIVKAHPAHPGTSEIVARAVRNAAAACGMPEGVFSMLQDSGHTIGASLVEDSRISAIGFTGSRPGGLALIDLAQKRPVPIPVYAEMSAINPVILLSAALDADAERIATDFVASLTLGAGQFCTNPGLLVAIEGPSLDRFVATATAAINAAPAATMLTPGIAEAYEAGIQRLNSDADVTTIARGPTGSATQGPVALFGTSAEAFVAHRALQEEVFGAAALLVRCLDEEALLRVIDGLEGQLTAALHLVDADLDLARTLIPRLERKVGRILINGFGTGVEVASAMVHGGPWPATSDSRTTSVGTLAIARFVRPVSYQNFPAALLPATFR